MSSTLDVHPASHEETIAAHRNVFDIWSKGLPLDEHIRFRLNSPSHSRATWFVGTLDGQVVVSLGSYPVRFHLQGVEVRGIAIGSIYTVKEQRGRGLAPQLLEGVERYEQARGAALSVLYSDIEPTYYARLGYVLCPALQGWREPAAVATDYRLVGFSPEQHVAELMRLYDGDHGAARISFARNAEYWGAILKKFPGDAFYWLLDAEDRHAGYVRIGHKDDSWRVTDFVLARPTDELAAQMYAALLKLAHQQGVQRVGGWMPDCAGARQYFDLRPRQTEITMIKPLGATAPLDAATIAAAGRFVEIDHV
jgi:predicted N-acetyltransferase YhbS